MEKTTEVAWAAGFFDGEGCITLRPNPRRDGELQSDREWSRHLHLKVTQKDKPPLLTFQRLFSGSISRETKGSRCYNWSLTSIRGAAALEQMLPFLVVKKELAGWGLRFQRTVHELRSGQRLSANDRAERILCWAEIHGKNSRLAP